MEKKPPDGEVSSPLKNRKDKGCSSHGVEGPINRELFPNKSLVKANTARKRKNTKILADKPLKAGVVAKKILMLEWTNNFCPSWYGGLGAVGRASW